jgi:hypothetical protein
VGCLMDQAGNQTAPAPEGARAANLWAPRKGPNLLPSWDHSRRLRAIRGSGDTHNADYCHLFLWPTLIPLVVGFGHTRGVLACFKPLVA